MEFFLYPFPASEGDDVIVVVMLDDPVESVTLAFRNRHYTLKPLAPGFWGGILSFPTLAGWHRRDMLVTLRQGRSCFYRLYQLPEEQGLSDAAPYRFLTATGSDFSSFGVYPKRESAVLSVPYVAPPADYRAGNILTAWDFLTVTSDLTISGIKTISLRAKVKDGTKDGFVSGVQRDELLQININGSVNDVKVNATIQDSSVDLDESNKNAIELTGKNWALAFGEYQAALSRNGLLSFRKRLDGVQGRATVGDVSLVMMAAESKGVAFHDELYGNQSQGPYRLSRSPVVIHSERIYVNGQELVREVDYRIDYEIGEVIFHTLLIQPTDKIVADYEYSDSLFKRSFLALDMLYHPSGNVGSVGVTLLDLSDNPQSNPGGTPPAGHQVLGIDSFLLLTENLAWHSALAYSENRRNLYDPSQTEKGWALFQGVTAKTKKLSLDVRYKRLDPSYYPLGDAASFPGLESIRAEGAYQFNEQLFQDVDWLSETYPKNGVTVGEQSLQTTTRAGIFNYAYFSRYDEDMSVTDNPLQRRQTRHQVGLTADFGVVRFQPGVRFERLDDPFNSAVSFEGTAWQLGTALGLANSFQLTSQISLEERVSAMNGRYRHNDYSVSAQFSPVRGMSVNGQTQWIEDSVAGSNGRASLTMSVSPFRFLDVKGQYDLESLREIYGTEEQPVLKHRGNFRVSLTPISTLRLTYRIKPSFQELTGLNHLKVDDEQVTQYAMDWTVFPSLDVAVDHKTTRQFLLNKQALPLEEPERISGRDVTLFQANWVPEKESTVRYSFEQSTDDALRRNTASGGGTVYGAEAVLNRRHQVEYLSRLLPSLKVGVVGKTEEFVQTYSLSPSSDTDRFSTTAELVSEWDVSRQLVVKTSGAVSRIDYRRGETPDTYTVAPRLDINYRPAPDWIFGGFYELNRSVSGQTTIGDKASLRARFDTRAAEAFDISVSAQVDYEGQVAPVYYNTWDVLFKVNVLF